MLLGCHDQFLEERYGEDRRADQLLCLREVAVACDEELGIRRQRAREEFIVQPGKRQSRLRFHLR